MEILGIVTLAASLLDPTPLDRQREPPTPTWLGGQDQLAYGEPDSDVLWFSARCLPGGTAELNLPGTLTNGQDVTLTFATETGSDVHRVTVEVVEEDDLHFIARVPVSAKLFDLMKTGEKLDVKVAGEHALSLPLAGAARLVEAFRQFCR
ncbi:MAG TPA: hypothetical protein VF744_09780 [Beijerinckiaceae bacterium]|jgi:hypothetical protein